MRNQLEARVEVAEERARVAQAQLAANREAANMESAQVAEQSNSLRRQAAAAERKLREEIAVMKADVRGAKAGEAAAIAREEEVMAKAVELIEQRDEQLRRAKDLAAAELRAGLARRDDEMRALRLESASARGSAGDLQTSEFIRNVERALQDERRRRVAAEEGLVSWKRAARESRREMEESREVADINDGLGRLRRQLSSGRQNSLKIPNRDKPVDAALLSPVDSPPRRRTPPPNFSQRESPRESPRVSGGARANQRDSQGSGRSDQMTRVERLARDSSLNFASKESSQVKLKIAPPRVAPAGAAAKQRAAGGDAPKAGSRRRRAKGDMDPGVRGFTVPDPARGSLRGGPDQHRVPLASCCVRHAIQDSSARCNSRFDTTAGSAQLRTSFEPSSRHTSRHF